MRLYGTVKLLLCAVGVFVNGNHLLRYNGEGICTAFHDEMHESLKPLTEKAI